MTNDVSDADDGEGYALADDIAGKTGPKRQASALNAVMIGVARKLGGGKIELTRDEFERACAFDGGIEVDIADEAVLTITLHEQGLIQT